MTDTTQLLWQPFIFEGRAVMTFRTLDQRRATVKGTTFRAFKQTLDQLHEGKDHWRLDSRDDAAAIARLKETGKVYPSSIHVVLLGETAVARIFPQRIQAG